MIFTIKLSINDFFSVYYNSQIIILNCLKMPKPVITKWREVNRSINQMIKSSSSESEHDIMNTEHMHKNENDVNM